MSEGNESPTLFGEEKSPVRESRVRRRLALRNTKLLLVPRERGRISCYRVAMMPDRRRCHPNPRAKAKRSGLAEEKERGSPRRGTNDGGESNLKRDHSLLAISSRRATWCLCPFLLFPAAAAAAVGAAASAESSSFVHRSSFVVVFSPTR